nr:unnamed protein product [Callosobruchus analis]
MKESTVLNWVKLDKSQEAERRSNDKRGEARRNHYQSRSLNKHYCDEIVSHQYRRRHSLRSLTRKTFPFIYQKKICVTFAWPTTQEILDRRI